MFQSAPLTDVRGDPKFARATSLSLRFQSAPLTDVRGDFVARRQPQMPLRCFNPLPSLM